MLASFPTAVPVGRHSRITEGSLSPVPCIDQDPKLCGRSGECITLPVWEGLAQVINTYLDSITLEDILNGDYKKCQTHP